MRTWFTFFGLRATFERSQQSRDTEDSQAEEDKQSWHRAENAKVFKIWTLIFIPLPEACQTQGFGGKKIWFVLKGAKNNLAFSCRRKQKILWFPPIWMSFLLGCGWPGKQRLGHSPGRRQCASTVRCSKCDHKDKAEVGPEGLTWHWFEVRRLARDKQDWGGSSHWGQRTAFAYANCREIINH